MASSGDHHTLANDSLQKRKLREHVTQPVADQAEQELKLCGSAQEAGARGLAPDALQGQATHRAGACVQDEALHDHLQGQRLAKPRDAGCQAPVQHRPGRQLRRAVLTSVPAQAQSAAQACELVSRSSQGRRCYCNAATGRHGDRNHAGASTCQISAV